MAQTILLLTISWIRILGALGGDSAEDQFGEEVLWSAFSSKPFVLVIADREASERAMDIGKALHIHYNGNYTAPEEHLRSSLASERLKVIPVAALPDVPGIFKWIFRRGFKKEATTGVILDWDSRLSKACGYSDGRIRLVLKLPNREEAIAMDVTNENEALLRVDGAMR